MRTRPPKRQRQTWSGRLHLAPDETPVLVYAGPGDWTPKPPPPLALNLNVSADVPTLETMCHT